MATTFSLVVVFLPVSFMSCISGRFLYRFGVTATVAILVSLVVSFSLTPMMSSRLLTSRSVAGRAGRGAAFTSGSTELHAHAAAGRCATAGGGVLAVLVMASAVPLYHMVRQEYLPTNVDESEFEMSGDGSRRHQPDGHGGRARRVEREV